MILTGPPSGAVSNSGPVVRRYEVPTLFEPFRRLGTERLASGSHGAGPGLSIVRAVAGARAHGGDVHAEPREGGGGDGYRDVSADACMTGWPGDRASGRPGRGPIAA